jgi:hypothetical protein
MDALEELIVEYEAIDLRATARSRAHGARVELAALREQLERITDWCDNWIVKGKIVSGANDVLAVKQDVERARKLLEQ